MFCLVEYVEGPAYDWLKNQTQRRKHTEKQRKRMDLRSCFVVSVRFNSQCRTISVLFRSTSGPLFSIAKVAYFWFTSRVYVVTHVLPHHEDVKCARCVLSSVANDFPLLTVLVHRGCVADRVIWFVLSNAVGIRTRRSPRTMFVSFRTLPAHLADRKECSSFTDRSWRTLYNPGVPFKTNSA